MSSLTVETPPARSSGRRPAWALPVVVLAVLVVAAAAVIGVRGLFGDPVVSTAADGTATISGAWQPVDCDRCVQGYVQAGARSVFVRLPQGCAAPGREAHVVLHGRPDATLGKHAYAATACPGA